MDTAIALPFAAIGSTAGGLLVQIQNTLALHLSIGGQATISRIRIIGHALAMEYCVGHIRFGGELALSVMEVLRSGRMGCRATGDDVVIGSLTSRV